MMITLDQAIEIHARVLIFRAGPTAVRRAQDTALSCKSRGDLFGHEVWMKVAATVEDLRQAQMKHNRPIN